MKCAWITIPAMAMVATIAGMAAAETAKPSIRPETQAVTKPAPAPAAKDLAPLPLKLPKPTEIGTPTDVPPGTRVKIPEGKWTLRKPFLAPKGVVNVALNKPVTSSDTEPVIGTLDLITDGDKEAVEDSYVELGYGVQYVQVDLEKAHELCAAVLWHEHKDRRVYHDVIVQVADDKDFITNVRTLFNNDHDNSAGMGIGKDWGYFETHEGLLVDAKGVKARYVRVYSNGSTADDLNRFTELSVFALSEK